MMGVFSFVVVRAYHFDAVDDDVNQMSFLFPFYPFNFAPQRSRPLSHFCSRR